ncbi:MAG: UbiA-like polyprenyltransferase [Paenibacillaceae bacterium]
MRKLKIFLEMIKFEHTLFALPFAYMGAILSSVYVFDRLPAWSEIGWITLAMIGARTAAMGLNRVIDRTIDAKNPRTANRAIPAGLISSIEVWLFIVISFVLLFVATSNLDPLSMKLLPIAVIFLVGYSYTKRFTWACHIILGLTIGLAPLGAWAAVTGEINMTAMIFYLAVALWTAGFDVLYACQDIDFDRKEGLHSIPSRFGITRALWIARGFHLLTAAGLFSLIWLADLSEFYIVGMIIAYIILVYEHRLVTPNDLTRLNTAFFTMNGVLSIVLFIFTVIDLVVRYG